MCDEQALRARIAGMVARIESLSKDRVARDEELARLRPLAERAEHLEERIRDLESQIDALQNSLAEARQSAASVEQVKVETRTASLNADLRRTLRAADKTNVTCTDFANKLSALAARVAKQVDTVQTEEAAKTAFVMPFIQALGYDVFDPDEVVPEFIADVGAKKGEKIDYAIHIEGKPAILIECKACSNQLNDEPAGQLRRYFHVVESRIGILTNGIRYMFFADLEKPNIMDKKPFMEIDLLDLNEQLLPELKKLCKASFELDAMISAASALKYMREIKAYCERQMSCPETGFVKLILGEVYSGMKTQQVVEQFTPLIKRALNEVVNDRIYSRLNSAMTAGTESTIEEQDNNGVVTSQEVWDGYYIVRAILHLVVDIERVFMRDTKSYCGVLLDNNNRKPICRLYFNHSKKYLGLFGPNKIETKVAIDGVRNIYDHAEAIRAAIGYYDSATEA